MGYQSRFAHLRDLRLLVGGKVKWLCPSGSIDRGAHCGEIFGNPFRRISIVTRKLNAKLQGVGAWWKEQRARDDLLVGKEERNRVKVFRAQPRKLGKPSFSELVVEHILRAILKIDACGIAREDEEFQPADFAGLSRRQEWIRGKIGLVFPVVRRRPGGRAKSIEPRA